MSPLTPHARCFGF